MTRKGPPRSLSGFDDENGHVICPPGDGCGGVVRPVSTQVPGQSITELSTIGNGAIGDSTRLGADDQVGATTTGKPGHPGQAIGRLRE